MVGIMTTIEKEGMKKYEEFEKSVKEKEGLTLVEKFEDYIAHGSLFCKD